MPRNPMVVRAVKARWKLNNKEALKVIDAAYRQTMKGRYNTYKSGAKYRGHLFDLSVEEFSTFWQKDCSYCGSAITTIGLDRIDSSVGYQIDNLISCCSVCNRMKLDHNEQEWLDKMFTILKYKGVI